jgi:hypothetical protein
MTFIPPPSALRSDKAGETVQRAPLQEARADSVRYQVDEAETAKRGFGGQDYDRSETDQNISPFGAALSVNKPQPKESWKRGGLSPANESDRLP